MNMRSSLSKRLNIRGKPLSLRNSRSMRHVASLPGPILLDSTELGGCNFHAHCTNSVNRP
jgi:hypothetical protein